ncbi:hypothetical protein BDA96_01G252000 [Sorghum bicolor]|uniref:Uncharacterized protein n=2 Tax=Sorghum bicolor TaxID=4558 RepID=A0A921S0P4_SORBI|nr:hypothetical protein BDA96_01G252000 [Sorghum bicolor]KXG38457.1 hypothetical protein SORBI_3001G237200 [Sorghum bicolor]
MTGQVVFIWYSSHRNDGTCRRARSQVKLKMMARHVGNRGFKFEASLRINHILREQVEGCYRFKVSERLCQKKKRLVKGAWTGK